MLLRKAEAHEMDNISYLIGYINRGAFHYFKKNCRNQDKFKCFIYEDNQNTGVMTIIEEDTFVVMQLAFEQEVDQLIIEQLKELIISVINQYHSKKEIYLNIYLNNPNLIKELKPLGFSTDMNGFEFKYQQKADDIELSEYGLSVLRFQDEQLDAYLDLLDDAFNLINDQNSSNHNQFKNHKAHYQKQLKRDDDLGNFGAIYLQDELIAIYTLYDHYIREIAVKPGHQHKGYGSLIVKHCLNQLMNVRKHDVVYLNTEATNIAAQQLYSKNGFIVSGQFAEHTYR